MKKQALTNEKEISIVEKVVSGIGFLILVYLGIGLCSIAEVSDGASHEYSVFWHTPWKIFFNHFGG